MSFSANCTCRDDPESPVAKRVFVITPKDVLPTCATRPGWPKFAWLKISKNSARNCTRRLSEIRVFFRTEKSVLLKPGPVIVFRPKLPRWKTDTLLISATGRANTESAGQPPGARGSHTVLVNH